MTVICPAIKAVKKPEESAKKVQIRMRFLIIFLSHAKAQSEEITPFAFYQPVFLMPAAIPLMVNNAPRSNSPLL